MKIRKYLLQVNSCIFLTCLSTDGGKKSVICVVKGRGSLKVRLTNEETCSTPDARWGFSG